MRMSSHAGTLHKTPGFGANGVCERRGISQKKKNTTGQLSYSAYVK